MTDTPPDYPSGMASVEQWEIACEQSARWSERSRAAAAERERVLRRNLRILRAVALVLVIVCLAAVVAVVNG